ncbi:MAG: hypothetical protein JRF61_27245 [Deltaproteobacteria bacterium]|nr:hypothetical protein [Deltaproteobacteria bacterium]
MTRFRDQAIEIMVDRVSLDLNGFTVSICVGVICGIEEGNDAINADLKSNVRIDNGTVKRAGRFCIRTGANSEIRNVQAEDCYVGIDVGPGSRVLNVGVTDSGLYGIGLGEGSLLKGSTVTNSADAGVRVGEVALLVDSVIQNNQKAVGGIGANVARRGGYRGCVITENNSGAEEQSISPALLDLGGNVCGTDTTCP